MAGEESMSRNVRGELQALFMTDEQTINAWIEEKKEEEERGVNIMAYKNTFRSYLSNPTKFLEEPPLSAVKNMSKSQMKKHLDNMVRVLGTKRTGKQNVAIELGESILSTEDWEKVGDLIILIRTLPESVQSSKKIIAILEEIREKTGGIRLYFRDKQPNEAFMIWLSKQLDGVYENTPFYSTPKDDKPKVEKKASIVFAKYNKEFDVIKAFNKWWGARTSEGSVQYEGSIGPLKIESLMKEGRPLVVGKDSKIVLTPKDAPKAERQQYEVVEFDGLIIKKYINALNKATTSGDKKKNRQSINVRQFIPTFLPDGERHFPHDLAFNSSNTLKLNPLFEVITTQSIGGQGWFSQIQKQSSVLKIFSERQITNMVVLDLVHSYQDNQNESEVFGLDVPKLLTKKGGRLEAENKIIAEKMGLALKNNSALSEAIATSTGKIAQTQGATISSEEKNAYDYAVNTLGIKDVIDFSEVKVGNMIRYKTFHRARKKEIPPHEYFVYFIGFLKDLELDVEASTGKKAIARKAIDKYIKSQTTRSAIQQWLGNTSDFVSSSLAALKEGHTMYGEVNAIVAEQNIATLKIDNLLDIILLLDESLSDDPPTKEWYEEIDSQFNVNFLTEYPLKETTAILEKIEEHTGKILEGLASEIQISFKLQLEGMIKKWRKGEPYHKNHTSLNAVITQPMLDELESRGIINRVG